MRDAAYELSMAFAQAARAEDDLDRKLTLFDAFHRGCASVRLSIALRMRLDRETRTQLRPGIALAEAERPETERPEVERPEVERSDAVERPERYDERDRDRETERVSFPLLLRTLRGVAHDAETLLPQAAELPTLRELLASVSDRPAPTPAEPTAPARPLSKAAAPLRERLAGSASTQVLIRPAARPGPPPRRATGPP